MRDTSSKRSAAISGMGAGLIGAGHQRCAQGRRRAPDGTSACTGGETSPTHRRSNRQALIDVKHSETKRFVMAHQQYASCIEACNTCADACDHCATACLKEDDVKMMARCIALDIDCAAICRLAAGYMARGSEFAQQVCRVCAEVCEACGDECAKHQHPHCQECAQACKRCAEECRRMAGAGARAM